MARHALVVSSVTRASMWFQRRTRESRTSPQGLHICSKVPLYKSQVFAHSDVRNADEATGTRMLIDPRHRHIQYACNLTHAEQSSRCLTVSHCGRLGFGGMCQRVGFIDQSVSKRDSGM